MYRCEAASIEGFVQQLAVCYVARGHWFYVKGKIPKEKDPSKIDRKLIELYDIGISKWSRARKRKQGNASVHYLRLKHRFVLIASAGLHPFFEKESEIRDVRREPIIFGNFSIGYKKGTDRKWHASVRLSREVFSQTKRRFAVLSLKLSVEALQHEIANLPYPMYAPVRRQVLAVLRLVNNLRAEAGLEQVPSRNINLKRKPVRTFPRIGARPESVGQQR